MQDFNIKLSDLKEVMQLKNAEARDKLNEKFQNLEGLAHELKTNLLNGIPGDQADFDKRVKSFGKNEIPPKPPKSIFRLAFEALQDPTLIMLMICAVISVGLSFYHPPADNSDEEVRLKSTDIGNLEWVEGVAIAIAVIVVVSVSSFNDWRKERQFRGLQDRIAQDNKSSVIRNGQVIQVNVKELVVGDVCCVKYGDLVPADGIIIQASDLKIDEASLTGETDLIKKNETENVTIFSGTHVMEGTGQFLVTAVGLNSQTGIIMTLLGATKGSDGEVEDDDDEDNKKKSKNKVAPKSDDPNVKKLPKPKKEKKHKSVLQTKLAKLAMAIGYVGMGAALLTFLILLFRMLILELGIRKKPWNDMFIKYILSYLIQGITVIVVAVPEGLPLAVTLALAYAVQKMTKDNNLVRHLDACETMGNATTICSDKTGTLTTNRMTAVQCWVGAILHKKIPEKTQVNENIRQLIYESASVNSNYTTMIEPAKQEGEIPKQIGNKTECALLGFVNNLGGNYEQIRNEFPNDQFVKVYTFNSARKMMSTIVRNKQVDQAYRLHSKGASEMVLGKCGWYLNLDGKPIRLTKDKIDDIIRNVVEPMAMDGLRTICIACRDFIPKGHGETQTNAKYFDQEIDWNDEPEIITDLTCLCLVGIEDPVRPEVPDAIKKCQTSGVVVRMVTGDNINTATSIAMKCGILKPGDDYLILESKEYNKRIRDSNGEVQQSLLDQVWPKLRVLARSSPTDKYILVNGIVESKNSENREVVAVTGDGTNDGPALKRADVGFAMGIQGTDVAKEASDIILTDDNFSSIVKALMWGRNVYDAIAKFLQFQLTVNFVAGVFSVVCAAAIQSVPLKAVQMLWVNLVMDTLASLALATEPPTEDLLKRKPYGRTKPIVSLTMMKNVVGQAVYQLAVLFGLCFGIESWMNVDDIIKYDDLGKLRDSSLHFTIIFNVFVIMTLFNELNARKLHNERNIFDGIQNNLLFIIIWFICFGGQIIIVNFGGIVFSVKPLEWDHWMWSLFLGAGTLLWQQLVLFIPDSLVEKCVSKVCCCCFKSSEDIKSNDEEMKKLDEPLNTPVVEIIEDKQNGHLTERSKTLWSIANKRIQSQLKVIRPNFTLDDNNNVQNS